MLSNSLLKPWLRRVKYESCELTFSAFGMVQSEMMSLLNLKLSSSSWFIMNLVLLKITEIVKVCVCRAKTYGDIH